jgi:dTDP-4-dehydrorhamnose 3,5-epimerase-like enzyme
VSDPGWKLVNLKEIPDPRGKLTVIESLKDVPFDIKRIYYIYGVSPATSRGFHAHKTLSQVVIAVSGEFKIELNDGQTTKRFLMNKPNIGLFIPPGIWREMFDFSVDAVCLVLASDFYLESDYIRDYDEFLKYKEAVR